MRQQGVSLIALPDAPLDYSARAEARLLRRGPPGYLREVWRSARWRLFAARRSAAAALGTRPAVSVSTDSASLLLPRPGSYLLRLRFTPYWELSSGRGCVERAPGGWTRVPARAPGRFVLGIGFSLGRVLAQGPRCT